MMKDFRAQFGGKITAEELKKYEASPQWNGKIFENEIETSMDFSLKDAPRLLYQNISRKKVRSPQQALPFMSFDSQAFESASDALRFSWFGHSAVYLRLNGMNLLIDPMLGPDSSPIAPFNANRFSKDVLKVVDEIPNPDIILITHDHYDHLDLASIRRMKDKCKRWFVALGVGRHLRAWGIPEDQITEFDWWDHESLDGLDITFTPSRHFSGRGTGDRAKSLWGGWVLQAPKHAVYWSGDGGYGPHFKEVNKRFGDFDLGFMENGQYNKLWHAIHMFPEEAVQAAQESGVKRAVPVHWGGFSLAVHAWQDPIERFVAEAEQKTLKILTPKLGQVVDPLGEYENEKWWLDFG